MQVRLKDLIKKKTHTGNCNLFDMMRFLTNWLCLLLVVIIPFMSGLCHCSESPQSSCVKVIQFSLWCSHRSHLQVQSWCCWATQMSLGQLCRCHQGHTARAEPVGVWQSLCTWDLKGQKQSWPGQQGLAQNPYALTGFISIFFKAFYRYQNLGGSARNSYFTGVFCIESWSHLGWKTL